MLLTSCHRRVTEATNLKHQTPNFKILSTFSFFSSSQNQSRSPLNVFLFIPCFVDQLFPDVGIATVNILKEFDCDLIYPKNQTCCGQPAFNSGYYDEAAKLAQRFMEIFQEAEYIVAPSGSCVAMVKNLYAELNLPQSIKREWTKLREKIYELSGFITSVLEINEWEGHFPARITYHDSCHALRELRIREQPRKLLSSIDGLELIEMKNTEYCCGFGGTFSIKFPQISTAMVQKKSDWIRESGADIVVSTDSSCLMNINGYMQRQHVPLRGRRPIRSMHIAEVLWQARKGLIRK